MNLNKPIPFGKSNIDLSLTQQNFIKGGTKEQTLRVLTTSALYLNDADLNFEDFGRIQAFILIKKYFDECKNSLHFLKIFSNYCKFEIFYGTEEIPNPFDSEELISSKHGDLNYDRECVLREILNLCLYLHDQFEEAATITEENEWFTYINKRVVQDILKINVQLVKKGNYPDLSLFLPPILMFMVEKSILGEPL